MLNTRARRLLSSVAVTLGVAALTGCANLNSISRTTTLETSEANTKTTSAIHLDAQQRLVIVNNLHKYCAEPSPDSMAAYAASLGMGASAAAKGSASLSGGGLSNAASIGLRTQSITLMRDALYRMCEAYANGAIGDAQVVTLLNRSQDLTAVILAVEQLTGAVAANQVALTGSTTASSYATALNNSKLYAEASAHEAQALKRLEEAKQEQAVAEANLERAEEKLRLAEATQKALSEEDPAPSDERRARADAVVEHWSHMQESAMKEVQYAGSRVEISQRAYDNAQSVAAEIAKTPDSSSASSAAGTSGGAEFSTPVARVILDKQATIAVAEAVRDMVKAVLDKDYVIDGCMSVVTSDLPENPVRQAQQKDSREFCQRLINAQLLGKVTLAESKAERALKDRISTVTGDVQKIMACIAPNEQLDAVRRDQLFKDANAKNDLAGVAYQITSPAGASEFRTMLAQNDWIRAHLASVVAKSAACK